MTAIRTRCGQRRVAHVRAIAHEILRIRRQGSFTGSTLPARYVCNQDWRNRHVHQPVARRSQRETATRVRRASDA